MTRRAPKRARKPLKLERLSCRRRVELLCEYLDRELPASQRVVVDLHRKSCKPCAQLLASLSKTVKVLRALKKGGPSAAAQESLRAALRRGAARRTF